MTNLLGSLPEDVMGSAAGVRVTWLLGQLIDGVTASDAEVAAAVAIDDARTHLERTAAAITGMQVLAAEADDDHTVAVTVKDGRGRYWLLYCRVEAEAPHRLVHVQQERTLPPGMEIRFATPDDNAALVEISRRTAIVLRSGNVIVDPGDDYFAATRLMEEWVAIVATDGGKVVGVQCATARPAMFGGDYISLSQVLHTRVLPDYAGLGLWSVMQSHMLAAGRERAAAVARGHAPAGVSESGPTRPPGQPSPTRQTGIAYVSVENEAMARLYGGVRPWKAQPFRVTLPCAALARDAGTPDVRTADASDSGRIVEILNTCHGREELYYPYTADAFAFRLQRAPDLYSWDDVLVAPHAVLGVWHSPETRIWTVDGVTTPSSRALVLDYGFDAGAEEEFEHLLRHACAAAAARGYHHLSIFSSDASPGAALLIRLGDRVERYDAIVPFASEPEGAAERGIYVDQVYF